MAEKTHDDPTKWIPDVPADAADFLDGEPPLEMHELSPAEQESVKREFAAQAAERAKLPK